jgi:hypothetical protein
MIFGDHIDAISDQAERPDLRLGLSIFLMADEQLNNVIESIHSLI